MWLVVDLKLVKGMTLCLHGHSAAKAKQCDVTNDKQTQSIAIRAVDGDRDSFASI